MALFISAPFQRGGAFPIDVDFVKTKLQMRSTNDAVMPSAYFCVGEEDGEIYIYRKSNTVDEETGKYRMLDTGMGLRFEPVDELPDTGEVGIIYLVPVEGSTGNTKEEWIWIEDETAPASGFYEKIGTTDIELTMGETFTTNIDVGGVKSGTTIDKDDSIMAVIKRMLTTIYYPTYNAPSASLAYGSPALAKVGSTVSAIAATVSFNPGAIMLQGTKQADRAGAATQFSIATSGADIEFNDSNATGTFNVSELTRSTKGNIVISGSVAFAEGPQPKDSAGEDYESPLAAGSVNAPSKTIEFILPFYHGVNAAESVTDLVGMTEDLTKKGNKTYSYTANNEYLYVAYDSSYGDLTSILDENNFENKDNFILSTVTHEGMTYKVYRSLYAITGSPKFTFKF